MIYAPLHALPIYDVTVLSAPSAQRIDIEINEYVQRMSRDQRLVVETPAVCICINDAGRHTYVATLTTRITP